MSSWLHARLLVAPAHAERVSMTHLKVLNAIIELSAPEGVIDLPQAKLL